MLQITLSQGILFLLQEWALLLLEVHLYRLQEHRRFPQHQAWIQEVKHDNL